MAKLTEDQKREMVGLFESMGVKGKNEAELQEWMVEYLKTKGKVTAAAEAAAVPTHTYNHNLKINTFSGDAPGKGDTTYDLWRHEILCLLKEKLHPDAAILEAIRKSVKGDAAKIVMRLGPGVTAQQIVNKLETVYGTVEAGDTLYTEFYASEQRQDETVVSWGLRVEDMLDKMTQHGLTKNQDTDEMLRSRFYNGLQQPLKDSTRHKYDTVAQYDLLRVEVRKMEREYQVKKHPPKEGHGKTQLSGVTKMVDAKDGAAATDMKELKGIVHKLTSTLENVQQELREVKLGAANFDGQHAPDFYTPAQQIFQHQASQDTATPIRGQGMGHTAAPGPYPTRPQAASYPPAQQQGYTPGGQRPGYGYGSQTPAGYGSQDARVGSGQGPGGGGCFKCGSPDHWKRDCPQQPVCYFCHQRGHVKKYCPFLLNR